MTNTTSTRCPCGCPLAAGHKFCSDTCKTEASATDTAVINAYDAFNTATSAANGH